MRPKLCTIPLSLTVCSDLQPRTQKQHDFTHYATKDLPPQKISDHQNVYLRQATSWLTPHLVAQSVLLQEPVLVLASECMGPYHPYSHKLACLLPCLAVTFVIRYEHDIVVSNSG